MLYHLLPAPFNFAEIFMEPQSEFKSSMQRLMNDIEEARLFRSVMLDWMRQQDPKFFQTYHDSSSSSVLSSTSFEGPLCSSPVEFDATSPQEPLYDSSGDSLVQLTEAIGETKQVFTVVYSGDSSEIRDGVSILSNDDPDISIVSSGGDDRIAAIHPPPPPPSPHTKADSDLMVFHKQTFDSNRSWPAEFSERQPAFTKPVAGDGASTGNEGDVPDGAITGDSFAKLGHSRPVATDLVDKLLHEALSSCSQRGNGSRRMDSDKGGGWGKNPISHFMVGTSRDQVSAYVGRNETPPDSTNFHLGHSLGSKVDPRVLHTDQLNNWLVHGLSSGPTHTLVGLRMSTYLDSYIQAHYAEICHHHFGPHHLFLYGLGLNIGSAMYNELDSPKQGFYIGSSNSSLGSPYFPDGIRFHYHQLRKMGHGLLQWKNKPPDTSLEDKTFSKTGVMIGI